MSGPSLPTIITEPWAAGGVFNTVPVPSQIAITPGRASWTDGFPPVTRIPVAAGGVPPFGEDMNGALNQLSYTAQYQQALSGYPYSAALSTALGGYPNSALVQTSDGNGFWMSTVNGNTNAPETNATGWTPVGQERPRTVAVTSVAQTLSILQSGSDTIILTGVLTGNTVITLTPFSGPWTFVNNTTGNFTLTAKVPAGTTALLTAGATVVQCDGTNISALSAQQIGAAVTATHAVQFGQVSGVVGQTRNLAATLTTAGTAITFTADEVVVESALGGLRYCISGLNQAVTLTGTGLNGMDTGTAPVSGFVGVYAMRNPTTGVSGLVATNAAALLPECYAGALTGTLAGFTASALIAVIPTNASSQFVACVIKDRSLDWGGANILATAATAATPTIINNLVTPLNAKTCSGFLQTSDNAAASLSFSLLSSSANTGGQVAAVTLSGAGSVANSFRNLKITVGQRLFYIASSSAGTPSFQATVSGYEI